jgi:hypothetical protein
MVVTALGAIVAAGAILDLSRRGPQRLVGLALVLFAGTLMVPFLDRVDEED